MNRAGRVSFAGVFLKWQFNHQGLCWLRPEKTLNKIRQLWQKFKAQ
jgi:hypothetical protein